jgi:ribose/xylose/arabinose/galactoside ABC-type transport system permease subunit
VILEGEGPIALGELIRTLDPRAMSGRLIFIPAINLLAVAAGRRTSPLDDLNFNRTSPATLLALRRNRLSPTGRLVVAAIVLALVLRLAGSILIGGYSSEFSVRSMLVLASLLGVASIGQTLVVLLGGIDLSTPFVIGFANVVAAQLYGDGMNFALVCLIVGAGALAIGAVNGALPSSLGVHPLIVTLGVGAAVQGAVLLWTAGFPAGSAPEAVTKFVSIGGHTGPLPVPWLIPSFLILLAFITPVLERTPFGRLYAVGANPQAAPYALISPRAIWTATYALSGPLRRHGRRAPWVHRIRLRRCRATLPVSDHRRCGGSAGRRWLGAAAGLSGPPPGLWC